MVLSSDNDTGSVSSFSKSPSSSSSSSFSRARASQSLGEEDGEERERMMKKDISSSSMYGDNNDSSSSRSTRSQGKRKMACTLDDTPLDDKVNTAIHPFDTTSMFTTSTPSKGGGEDGSHRTRIRTDDKGGRGESAIAGPSSSPSSSSLHPPPLLTRRRSSRLLASASASARTSAAASTSNQAPNADAHANDTTITPWDMGALDGSSASFTFNTDSPYSRIEAARERVRASASSSARSRAISKASASADASTANASARRTGRKSPPLPRIIQPDDPSLINVLEIHPAPFLFGVECDPRIYEFYQVPPTQAASSTSEAKDLKRGDLRRTASLPTKTRKSSPHTPSPPSSTSASPKGTQDQSTASTSSLSTQRAEQGQQQQQRPTRPRLVHSKSHASSFSSVPPLRQDNVSSLPSRPKLVHSRSHATSISVSDLGLNKWIASTSSASKPSHAPEGNTSTTPSSPSSSGQQQQPFLSPPLISVPLTASPAPASPTQSSSSSSSSSSSNQYTDDSTNGSSRSTAASSSCSNTSNSNRTTPPSPANSNCSSSCDSASSSSSSSSSTAFKRASEHYMLDTIRLKKRKLSHRIRSFLLLRPPGPPRIGTDGAADIESIIRAPPWLKNATSQLSRESRMAPEEWFWSGNEADSSTWTVTLLEKQFTHQLRLGSRVGTSLNSNPDSSNSSGSESEQSTRSDLLHSINDTATVFTRQVQQHSSPSSASSPSSPSRRTHDHHHRQRIQSAGGGEGETMETEDGEGQNEDGDVEGDEDNSDTSTILGEIRITSTPSPRKRQSSAPPAMEANPDQIQQESSHQRADTLVATFYPSEQGSSISKQSGRKEVANFGKAGIGTTNVGTATAAPGTNSGDPNPTDASATAAQKAPPPEVLKSQLLAVLRSRLPEGSKSADAPLRMKKFVVWNAWVRRATIPSPRLRYRRTTSPEASDMTKGPVLAAKASSSASSPPDKGVSHVQSKSEPTQLASPTPVAIPNQSQHLVRSHIDEHHRSSEEGNHQHVFINDTYKRSEASSMDTPSSSSSFDPNDENYDPFTIFDDDEDDDDIFNEVERALDIHLGSSAENTSHTARRFSNAFADDKNAQGRNGDEGDGSDRSFYVSGPFLGAGKLVDSTASHEEPIKMLDSNALLLSPEAIPSSISSSPPAGLKPDLPNGQYFDYSGMDRPKAPLRTRMESGNLTFGNGIIQASSWTPSSSSSMDLEQSAMESGDPDGPITPYWLEDEQFHQDLDPKSDSSSSLTENETMLVLPGAIPDGRYEPFRPHFVQNDSSPSLSPSDRKVMASSNNNTSQDDNKAFNAQPITHGLDSELASVKPLTQ